MYLFVYLLCTARFVYLYIWLPNFCRSICFICLPDLQRLPVHLFLYLSVIYQSTGLPVLCKLVCLSTHLFTCFLKINLLMYLSVYLFCTCRSVYPYICLPNFCRSICLSIYLFTCYLLVYQFTCFV